MGCTLRLLRPGFTLTFLIQQHMHVAESTMSQSISETGICPNAGTKVFYYHLRMIIQYICASISQWGSHVRDNPHFIPSEEKKKTFGEDAHTFGSSPAQQILPKKLNGVFVLARSSVHSILAPVNLLSWVICAPQSWLILSPSRRRAALAVALRAPALQECRGTSGRPLLTFSLWISSHTQYLQEQKCSK